MQINITYKKVNVTQKLTLVSYEEWYAMNKIEKEKEMTPRQLEIKGMFKAGAAFTENSPIGLAVFGNKDYIELPITQGGKHEVKIEIIESEFKLLSKC